MALDKGTKIRVIGGKHKGKWGFVFREMPEFSIVRLMDYVKSKALGDDEDVVVEREVRSKNIYLEVIPETVFEMPDEIDLYAVGQCDEEWDKSAQEPEPEEDDFVPAFQGAPKPLPSESPQVMDKIIEDLIMNQPKNDDDLLSNHSDEDPVDITGILPTIDEALKLKHKEMSWEQTIDDMEQTICNLQSEKQELAEAVELFIKLADYLKTRLS